MAFETSSTLLYFLTKELKNLENGKVEKIYQIEENIIFRFYKEGEKKNLRILIPDFICLTTQEFEAPMNPPGFCVFLRKYLTNARVISVEQKEFERILLLTFFSKGEEYFLIIELFKPGNIVLCKKTDDLIILNSLIRQKFKDREISARKNYIFPPILINPLTVSEQDLIKLIKESDRNLVKTLASKLGLGGTYAEEILHRANIQKDLEKINKEEAEKINKSIKEFFSEKISPVLDKEKVYPVNMLTVKGEQKNNISETIDSLNPLQTKEKQSKKTEKKKEKTTSLVEIQEKMIKNLEKSIKENQEKGEFVYTHYQEFQKLINEANNIRNKEGLDSLEKAMKQNKKFISINKKDKAITLKF